MKLYRKMVVGTDGKPLTGGGSSALGVRPFDPNKPKNQRCDVKAVNPTDVVPPKEGMSCFDDPTEIPAAVSGEMFVIETDDLPTELSVHQRGKNPQHFHIEPTNSVELGELQQLLADTRDLWERADGGTNP